MAAHRPHLNRFHHPGDRERIRQAADLLPVVGKERPRTQEEAVFLVAFLDNPSPASEFRSRQNPAPEIRDSGP